MGWYEVWQTTISLRAVRCARYWSLRARSPAGAKMVNTLNLGAAARPFFPSGLKTEETIPMLNRSLDYGQRVLG